MAASDKEFLLSLPAPSPAQAHETWPPEGTRHVPAWSMPGWGGTIWRGVRGCCPRCANAPIFDGYLKVHAVCAACNAPLGQMPADDAPPYIAMLAVLHVVAVIVVMIFRYQLSPSPLDYGILLGLLVTSCMVTLRMAKGAVIGILLKLGLKREALR